MKDVEEVHLDREEQEILDAFESGEFKYDLTSARKKFIEKSAAQTFKKDKKINITISGRDLTAIHLWQVLFINTSLKVYMTLWLFVLQGL
jgi:predicted DNA binding CopG/RHH family protein